MKALILSLILLVSTGCESMRKVHALEYTWQALHVYDVGQTYQVAKNPRCFMEADPITRKLIGEKPKTDRIIKWGIASAVAHFLVFNAVDKSFKKRVSLGLRSAEIVAKADVVKNNYADGLRLDHVNWSKGDALKCVKFYQQLQALDATIYRF